MPAQPSTDKTRLIQPAEKVQSEFIYLQHPSLPTRLKLLRGSVAKTLIRFGYIELTQDEYERDDDDCR